MMKDLQIIVPTAVWGGRVDGYAADGGSVAESRKREQSQGSHGGSLLWLIAEHKYRNSETSETLWSIYTHGEFCIRSLYIDL